MTAILMGEKYFVALKVEALRYYETLVRIYETVLHTHQNVLNFAFTCSVDSPISDSLSINSSLIRSM